MAERKVELPPICDGVNTIHQWAEITVHGCGYGSGDHAVDEALILPRLLQAPTEDAICNNCFQRYNAPLGERDSALVAAFLAISAW